MNPVEIKEGSCPIILAMPHSGTWLPQEIFAGLNEIGQKLRDTDWHIDRLYDGLLPEASIVKANFHRYVIDANRDPEGVSLYPGQNTTTLCPTIDFDGAPIWHAGKEPDMAQVKHRTEQFHAPYHKALRQMIEVTKAKYGFAILYDCHSIRSEAPFLFEGVLPVLNIGTNDSKSCSSEIEKLVTEACADSSFSQVLNGRFKGGWTTRYYGNPSVDVHAIQMELTQAAYMQETDPWAYLPERAETLRQTLQTLLLNLRNFDYVSNHEASA
ncbi:MAG: N-formylglutamate deformylase [Rickettsiales bacterium]|nr:N-formylglutamate deformylase [Rickettsiales bacterium]